MKNKRNIEACKKYFLVMKKTIIYLAVCLFIPFCISGQVYIEPSTKVFIQEHTINNHTWQENKTSACSETVYVVEGTVVWILTENSNSAIALLGGDKSIVAVRRKKGFAHHKVKLRESDTKEKQKVQHLVFLEDKKENFYYTQQLGTGRVALITIFNGTKHTDVQTTVTITPSFRFYDKMGASPVTQEVYIQSCLNTSFQVRPPPFSYGSSQL